ncbi:MAG TPA: PIN domain-containing protein [Terriglobales bacterium]|jgi:predicted nucleic acid-binding protein|nr:PIN domain-containing protein [Terriglobales bacterium]
MSGKYFVDTNVLIYAHNRSAGEKHRRAAALVQQLWGSNEGILSTQVLQEFCFNIRRKMVKPLSPDDTARILQQYFHWHIVVNTPISVVDAMILESRYQISFWDALILTAAQSSGASIVYSEDFSHGQIYGSVRAINPFQ